jgi:SagB-type dehydrogenase family enzyme
MGLSAWKSYGGSSWALRINPSSGNLHPTEAYLVLPPLPGTGGYGGVFHYNPLFHGLEHRAVFDEKFWSGIRGHFGTDGFLAGLSSVYWREAWKYGERAFRYSNHDTGHALACLSLSGNLLGWKASLLNALSDDDLGTILGFREARWTRFEEEVPELLLFVHKNSEKEIPLDIPDEIMRSFISLPFKGEPNTLSDDHLEWPVIEDLSSLTVKLKTSEKRCIFKDHDYYEKGPFGLQAAEVIRRRRSALAYDGKASVTKKDLFGMLDRTIPRKDRPPFDLGLCDTSVHLLIFSHRVTGLEPGLYLLIREERDLDSIKGRCRSRFLWEKVEGFPGLLYLLERDDFRSTAEEAGCRQEIASDGCFSIAMIARFREEIEREPFSYRRLHWEAGMIGQVLYLEAEAHGMRGTGMGCFFDDVAHELLGFPDDAFQDLYHFSVGKPVEDKRLTTLPAYHHLKRKGHTG